MKRTSPNYLKMELRLCVFSLLLISHTQVTRAQGFEIDVRAKVFADSTKVKLYDRYNTKYLDSTIVLQEKFILKGNVNQPSLCYINFYDKKGNNLAPYTFLFVENTRITIEGTYDNFLYPTMRGSRQTDLLRAFDSIGMKYKIKRLKEVEGLTDKIQTERINSKYSSLRLADEKRFVFDNADSEFAIDEIWWLKKDISKDSLLLFWKKLSSARAQSVAGKAIFDYATISTLKEGEQLRTISGIDLRGVKHKLSNLRGKVILLDFWHSGCVPCRLQNKEEFQRLVKKYANENFALVSFSINDTKAPWARASQEDHITWLNISDLKGEKSENAIQYAVQGIPNSFLFDQNGTLIKSFEGFESDKSQIEDYIDKLLTKNSL